MEFEPRIYWCADDFGLTAASCDRILQCNKDGFLGRISVFPNSDVADLRDRIRNAGNANFGVHINLVEGKCVSDKSSLSLLVDGDGYFKKTYTGLLALSLSPKRKLFKKQLKTEIKAQIEKTISVFPDKTRIMLDSHQHTHTIPLVFSALSEVIEENGLEVGYIRTPAEPLSPFIKTPSLFGSYISVNLIKQWLINFFTLINRGGIKKLGIPSACFFGIMFSGKMTEERVRKLLPAYVKYAKKHRCDIEILFHPGYVDADEPLCGFKFKKFYLSENRRREYDALRAFEKNRDFLNID